MRGKSLLKLFDLVQVKLRSSPPFLEGASALSYPVVLFSYFKRFFVCVCVCVRLHVYSNGGLIVCILVARA